VKTLSDLGERKAIKLIENILTKGDNILDIGDDCAALDFEKQYLLVTTDMISQKTHIPKEMTPFQIGWFIVSINLSDIAAKGGKPLGVVLSYGLQKKTSAKYLKELTRGANTCATTFKTNIIGGDTKETSEITICGTAFGIVNKDEFIPRKGAKTDDLIAVTGSLGKAGAGYYCLKNNILNKNISKALLEPFPKLKEGQLLAQQKCATSCMDLSDGLSSSLYQLSEINDVGFEINYEKIPISSSLLKLKKKNTKLNVSDFVLHFGGDYELLLTIPPNFFPKIKNILEKNDCNLYSIGKVTKDKHVKINLGNNVEILENKGYEHFKKQLF